MDDRHRELLALSRGRQLLPGSEVEHLAGLLVPNPHLQGRLADVAELFAQTTRGLLVHIPRPHGGYELPYAMRQLLLAKDAACRAALTVDGCGHGVCSCATDRS